MADETVNLEQIDPGLLAEMKAAGGIPKGEAEPPAAAGAIPPASEGATPEPETEPQVSAKDFQAMQSLKDKESAALRQRLQSIEAELTEARNLVAQVAAARKSLEEDVAILQQARSDDDVERAEAVQLATMRMRRGRQMLAEAEARVGEVQKDQQRAYEAMRRADAKRLALECGVEEEELLKIADPHLMEATAYRLGYEKKTKELTSAVKGKTPARFEAGEGTRSSGKRTWKLSELERMTRLQRDALGDEITRASEEDRILIDQ